MQGGASTQFAAVPMNLIAGRPDVKLGFIVTGVWSQKAYEEAKRLFPDQVVCLMDTKPYRGGFQEPLKLTIDDASVKYVYYW